MAPRTDWNPVLRAEFAQPYWAELQAFVDVERQAGPVFPPATAVFAPPTGELVLPNEHSAWARVRVGDMDIGILGPLTSGVVHEMKSGVYTVTMTYPNGFTLTEMVPTTPSSAPPAPSGT